MNKVQHWDTVYGSKAPHEVSWTQTVPRVSLDFIKDCDLPLNANIIDIGGGDSLLVDHLLDLGYLNLSVLDISANAISKAQKRLGKQAEKVKWIVSDITAFDASETYDVWHDRATFHFLTTEDDIAKYLRTAAKSIDQFMIMGTFSDSGPDKCSGLEIKKYAEIELESQLSAAFEKLKCISENHITPFKTEQNFLFCRLKKKTGP